MRVLLTGAFGLVGRNVVRALMSHNARLDRGSSHPQFVWLTCFDRKSPATVKIKEELEKECGASSFVVMWGDITNVEHVNRVAQGQDEVIHLAAIIPPAAYSNNVNAEAVNVQGTKNLLVAIATQNPLPRFIFASSYSVCGPRNPHKNPPTMLTPDTPVRPSCTYAMHKVKCEGMVRQYAGDWLILRLGAVTPPMNNTTNNDFESHIRFLFSIPRAMRRHGVHAEDCGLAFAHAALTPRTVTKRVFMIGGDSSWKMTAGTFVDQAFGIFGLGEISPLAFRDPSHDCDDAYYYEDWMDTSTSQAILDFHRHTFQDWIAESIAGQNKVIRSLTWLVSPIAKMIVANKSPHYRWNVSGQIVDPEKNIPFAELCPGAQVTAVVGNGNGNANA